MWFFVLISFGPTFQCVRIGSEFQATVPDGLCRYDDALPYENEDKLLWDPKILSEEETERYLNKVRELKILNQDSKKNDGKKVNSVIRKRKRNRLFDTIITKDDEQVSTSCVCLSSTISLPLI